MCRPIGPNTKLTKEDSILHAEEHLLYKSIIGSWMYLVSCTSPDLPYPVSYLSQFLGYPSKSQLPAAKYRIQYIQGTKDLKLSLPRSIALENTLEGYSEPDYGKCQDTW
jgi:hypothetical protein